MNIELILMQIAIPNPASQHSQTQSDPFPEESRRRLTVTPLAGSVDSGLSGSRAGLRGSEAAGDRDGRGDV